MSDTETKLKHTEVTVTVTSSEVRTTSKQEQRAKERRKLLFAVLALSFCCQLGVFARFGTGQGSQTVFNAGSALSTSLPANILGSFIMGCLSDGKALLPSLRQVVDANHAT